MELVTIRGLDGRYWSFDGNGAIVTGGDAAAANKLFELVPLDGSGLVALRPPGVDTYVSESFCVDVDSAGRRSLLGAEVESQSALFEAMQKQKNCCGTDGHEHPEEAVDPNLEWNDEQHRSVLTTSINHLVQLYNADPIGPAARRVHELCTNGGPFRQALYDGLWKADYEDDYTGLFAGVRAYYLHFYDPDTNGHFMPNVPFLKKGNARTCFVDRFNDATRITPERNPKEAGFQLGLALHYLTDLSQPMHAANFPNLWAQTLPNPNEWRHSNFETYADNRKIEEAWWEGDYDPKKWGSSPEEVIVAVARKGKRIWTKQLKAHVEPMGGNEKFGSAVDPVIVEAVRLGYEATIMALVYFGQQARRS